MKKNNEKKNFLAIYHPLKILGFIKSKWIEVDKYFFDDFFDNRNSFEEKKNNLFAHHSYLKENAYFVYFFIALIAKLAKCDAPVSAKEQKAFLSEFQKLGFNNIDSRKFFISAIDDKHASDFYTKKIKLLYNNKQEIFEIMLEVMIRIAESDAPINKTEFNFIKNIATEFKINSGQFDKIFLHTLANKKMTDPYIFLGVSRKVTKDELNQIYRNLAKKFHPDNYVKYENVAEQYKVVMQNRFDLYTKAYMQIKSSL